MKTKTKRITDASGLDNLPANSVIVDDDGEWYKIFKWGMGNKNVMFAQFSTEQDTSVGYISFPVTLLTGVCTAVCSNATNPGKRYCPKHREEEEKLND